MKNEKLVESTIRFLTENKNNNDFINKEIKDWYYNIFCDPTEFGEGAEIEAELCANMNDTITFKEFLQGIAQGKDVYEMLNVGDSTVRERVFEGISTNLNIDYDILYYSWLYDFEDENRVSNVKKQPYLDKLKELLDNL